MNYDTVIIGAGAAGMMCAATAAGRTLIVDHAKSPGEKIRISGGGRCNFTNLHTAPERFLSCNPHFHKSALSRYTQWDFIELLARHGIAWHEKTLGQLFCDGSAREVVAMLRSGLAEAGAELWLETGVRAVAAEGGGFAVDLEPRGRVTCRNLVIATGGKSIPKMGATGLAYDLARQFGHEVVTPRPALVPLTFPPERFAELAGVSLPVRVTANGASFAEAMLFTHRGLSGPAILQASSYWREGEPIRIDLLPGEDPFATLRARRCHSGRRNIATELGRMLPARLATHLAREFGLSGNLADNGDAALKALAARLADWELRPSGSEGYRTAEVTLGGIDTGGLSSRTMMSRLVPGLYFIGEAVDVTGWLGGYNFQWAWSSGRAAARAITERLQ